MSNSDESGYGKPPRNHQWKPGQSGNPGGRPKAPKSMFADAAAILSQPVRIKSRTGREKNMDLLEGAYLNLCLKAVKDDKTALFQTVKIILDVIPAGQKKTMAAKKQGFEARRKFARMLGYEVDANGVVFVPGAEEDHSASG